MSPGSFELEGKRVWVAGHRGMVGRALCRRLAAERCAVITCERREVDLSRQAEAEAWFDARRPDAVDLAAAKLGGILANDRHPAAFLYDNLMIEANVVHAAHTIGVEKLVLRYRNTRVGARRPQQSHLCNHGKSSPEKSRVLSKPP